MAKISVEAEPLSVIIHSEGSANILWGYRASEFLDEIYKSEKDFKTVCNTKMYML